MSYNYLLNTIELKDGRKLLGIVDFVTTKQLYFFDFTNEHTIDYVTLSILWKGNHAEMRFSVFCTVEYPNVRLPKVVLIPQSNIKDIKGKLPDYKKPKQKKRLIKVIDL